MCTNEIKYFDKIFEKKERIGEVKRFQLLLTLYVLIKHFMSDYGLLIMVVLILVFSRFYILYIL